MNENKYHHNIESKYKIKVFLSSKCGDGGKYDDIRKAIKKKIEDTGFVSVYAFEQEGASSLSPETHFINNLKDSDVCIFLIDTTCEIPEGVSKEIKTADNYKIKCLYYFFVNSESIDKSEIIKHTKKKSYCTYKQITNFDDFLNAPDDLIDDILSIYHWYCNGFYSAFIPKQVMNDLYECKKYISELLGLSTDGSRNEEVKSSELDKMAKTFLTVLFECKSIKEFNVNYLLKILENYQDKKYFEFVKSRWNAIQSFYLGDTIKCKKNLEYSLEYAKENLLPTWVIQDVLIDLRYLNKLDNRSKNFITVKDSYQEKINKIEEYIDNPVLNKISSYMYEKYFEKFYKKQIFNANLILIDDGYYCDCVKLLTEYIIASIYSGSLVRILNYYYHVKNFIFYLCCNDDRWEFRKNLLKFAIFTDNKKVIENIQNFYPEVMNKMNCEAAKEIMEFCNNEPIKFLRESTQLLAFGAIGYYLSDFDFKNYKNLIIDIINQFISNKDRVNCIGDNIFFCLEGVAQRMNQDELAKICSAFIKNSFSYFYSEMFKFIENCIDISENKMNQDCIQSLIECIISVIENKEKNYSLQNHLNLLCKFRKQNPAAMQKLDDMISKNYKLFYEYIYKVNINIEEKKDLSDLLIQYINKIDSTNKIMEKQEIFSNYDSAISILKAILQSVDISKYSSEIIDSLISTVLETLFSMERIREKHDAIHLLTCITIKYPQVYNEYESKFKKIIENKNEVLNCDYDLTLSTIDIVSLEIAIAFLRISMGENVYYDILEDISSILNDKKPFLAMKTIINFFESDANVVLPKNVETVIFQSVLQWLQFDNNAIKYNAVRILFFLTRNSKDATSFINNKIINIIEDVQCVPKVKILILQLICRYDVISEETRNRIFSKCENDPCFVVRKKCAEIQSKELLRNKIC